MEKKKPVRGGEGGNIMIESKHVIINHLNRWVESYDIVKEWDSDGHIIRQEVVNYRREWT